MVAGPRERRYSDKSSRVWWVCMSRRSAVLGSVSISLHPDKMHKVPTLDGGRWYQLRQDSIGWWPVLALSKHRRRRRVPFLLLPDGEPPPAAAELLCERPSANQRSISSRIVVCYIRQRHRLVYSPGDTLVINKATKKTKQMHFVECDELNWTYHLSDATAGSFRWQLEIVINFHRDHKHYLSRTRPSHYAFLHP